MTYNVFGGTLNLTQSILFCHASGVKEKGIENVSDVCIGSICLPLSSGVVAESLCGKSTPTQSIFIVFRCNWPLVNIKAVEKGRGLSQLPPTCGQAAALW